ncbi:MAG: hypothetical protein BGP08_16425 [Rhizobiales bacterium 64-17]|mgnify:CR=1 FL=1|nr:MAG: hypothetical protein BGP08_16425 [Rhizobiales bacterium 64-17]
MMDPVVPDASRALEPVRADEGRVVVGGWTRRLILFLRVMAGLAMIKGLYHWARLCGIGVAPDDVFEAHTSPWQVATIFFAVIDLVAAVGLWLAAPWGAVVWLTSIVSMIAVEILFPQVLGGGSIVTFAEFLLLLVYLWLALKAAGEHPG